MCKTTKSTFNLRMDRLFDPHRVRTVREECLDKLIIINQQHLRRVLLEYTSYYHSARPHQGLEQRIPVSQCEPVVDSGPVMCHDVLGGIIHDYQRAA